MSWPTYADLRRRYSNTNGSPNANNPLAMITLAKRPGRSDSGSGTGSYIAQESSSTEAGMFIVGSRLGARATLSTCLVVALACSDDTGTEPTDVTLGETTFVVLVNPIVNDDNATTVPPPGGTQSGVNVSVAGGPSGSTGASGVVVLAPVEPGAKTLSVDGSDVSVSIAAEDLREVAIALDGGSASVMANVRYAFGGQVIEITPSMSLTEVNNALSQSNTIVLFRAGSYTGDLQFSGSNVTLFGEGTTGGTVTLNGNVTVDGSGNRIRGTRITGNLSLPGSNAGISFSSVVGDLQLDGSGSTLLNNSFCGSVAISGSSLTALGNGGMAPIAAPIGGC